VAPAEGSTARFSPQRSAPVAPCRHMASTSFHVGRAHNFWLAKHAPSARAPSLAQAIVGTTVGAPAKVAKPQSTPVKRLLT